MFKTKYFFEYPKQIFKLLEKKNIFLLVLYLFISIVLSFVEALGIGVLALFVGLISEPQVIINKIPIDELRNYLFSLPFDKLITYTAILILILFCLKIIFIFFFNIYELKLKKKILILKSEKIFFLILKKNYEYFVNISSAKLTNTVFYEVVRVVNFIFSYFRIFKELIFLAILFAPLFLLNIKLSTITLFIVILISLIFLKTIKPKLIFLGEKIRKHQELLLNSLKEVYDTIDLIKLTEKYPFFINKYSNQLNLKTESSNKKQIYQILPRLFLELIAIVAMLALAIFLLKLDIQKQILVSTLSFLALIALRMLPVINSINIEISNAIYNQKAFDRYYEDNILNLKNINFEKKDINQNKINTINFKNVSFSYSNTKDFILKDISFELSKNSIIGIHGISGSGKSTLIKLIMGLLKPVNGVIEINSKPIDYLKNNIGNRVGYVPQDIFLVNATLSSNIALQKNKHEINSDKIQKVVKLCNLEDLIKNSKNDYELKIVDKGFNISGGQRQRIGIARAIYQGADILVLDEPNNNLDEESSKIIKQSLIKLKKDRIIIVISHSKDFLDFCDKNFLINNMHVNLNN